MQGSAEQPKRYITAEDQAALRPVIAVWELTLACDLKCHHCGSRAGKRRSHELSTGECLDLVRQLAEMGVRNVSLIGGEAYLRRDWLRIIRAIRVAGMGCTLQSGGLHLTSRRIKEAVAAGLQGIGISVDGLADLHDDLRGVKGSYAAALNALIVSRELGLPTGVNTQISSPVIPQLRELMECLIGVGARNWQIQFTVAMGRAADHPELLVQPFQLLEVMPLLADLYRDGAARGLLLQPGNNIGYFGPYESLWRGSGDESIHWVSCNAGQNTIGIEADGTIKGCPSLPTSPYAGGNIREKSLAEMWRQSPQLKFTRKSRVAELWGYCRSCYYAEECQGGCTWTTHVLFGRPGNNPYCHHRVLDLARKGLRERIALAERAPGEPFDYGRFSLLVETNNGAVKSDQHAPGDSESVNVETGESVMAASWSLVDTRASLIQIQGLRKEEAQTRTMEHHTTTRARLDLCRGCNRHIKPRTRICPHCNANVAKEKRIYARQLRKARQAKDRLSRVIEDLTSEWSHQAQATTRAR